MKERIFVTHTPCDAKAVEAVIKSVKQYGGFRQIIETQAGLHDIQPLRTQYAGRIVHSKVGTGKVMGFWKTLKWNAAAISIGSVALGVILTGWPAIAARTVCYLLAAVLLLGAFSYLLSYLSGRRQGLPSGMDLAIGLLLILAAAFVAVESRPYRRLGTAGYGGGVCRERRG